MAGSSRSSARSRIKSTTDSGDDGALRSTKPNFKKRRNRSEDHSLIRILNVDLKIILGIGVCSFLVIFFLINNLMKPVEQAQRPRVVTPFPAPKLMDLPQVASLI